MTRFVIVLCVLLAVVAAGPGRKKPSASDGKIVGGRDTDISRVPYQVSLQYFKRHICGGSLITSRHVLTAAHCVERGKSKDYSVRAGSTFHAAGGETRKVSKITSHPKYKSATENNTGAVLKLNEPVTSLKTRIMPWKNKIRTKLFDNDAAVLELDRPLEFSKTIQTISLAQSEPRPGQQVLVSGWGATQEGGSAHWNLQSTTVPVVSRQTCQRALMRYNTVTENMWCAGYLSGGKDTCQGDSGGPAVVNGRQAGIVSWGNGCAQRHSPGVYTNIAKIRPWIQEKTRDSHKKAIQF